MEFKGSYIENSGPLNSLASGSRQVLGDIYLSCNIFCEPD